VGFLRLVLLRRFGALAHADGGGEEGLSDPSTLHAISYFVTGAPMSGR